MRVTAIKKLLSGKSVTGSRDKTKRKRIAVPGTTLPLRVCAVKPGGSFCLPRLGTLSWWRPNIRVFQ
jgi:hypothetical protein